MADSGSFFTSSRVFGPAKYRRTYSLEAPGSRTFFAARNGIRGAGRFHTAVESGCGKQQRGKIFVGYADPVNRQRGSGFAEFLFGHCGIQRLHICGLRTAIFNAVHLVVELVAGKITHRRHSGCPNPKLRQHDFLLAFVFQGQGLPEIVGIMRQFENLSQLQSLAVLLERPENVNCIDRSAGLNDRNMSQCPAVETVNRRCFMRGGV